MKYKLASVFSVAVLASAGLAPVAAAQGIGTGAIHADATANVGVEAGSNATTAQAQAAVHGNATSSAMQETDHGNATSTAAKANGEITTESHSSTVAAFVQALLGVADREGGIGTQVRAVAMAQQGSASTSASAIAKVEARSGISTFFFGSDYKSLGQLRSEMVTTQNNIDQLKSLLTQTTNEADKADLSAQIKVLEDSQATMSAFVQAHENSFSVFGWFTKWFQ